MKAGEKKGYIINFSFCESAIYPFIGLFCILPHGNIILPNQPANALPVIAM